MRYPENCQEDLHMISQDHQINSNNEFGLSEQTSTDQEIYRTHLQTNFKNEKKIARRTTT